MKSKNILFVMIVFLTLDNIYSEYNKDDYCIKSLFRNCVQGLYKNVYYSIKNSYYNSHFFNKYLLISTKLNYSDKYVWWNLYDYFVIEPYNNDLFYIYDNYECK